MIFPKSIKIRSSTSLIPPLKVPGLLFSLSGKFPNRSRFDTSLLNLEPYRRVHTYLKAYDKGEGALNELAYYEHNTEALSSEERISMLKLLVK